MRLVLLLVAAAALGIAALVWLLGSRDVVAPPNDEPMARPLEHQRREPAAEPEPPEPLTGAGGNRAKPVYSGPLDLWWRGSRAEAIDAMREQAAKEATAGSWNDYLTVALLEAGDPVEAVDQTTAWLGRIAALSAMPPAIEPPIPSLFKEKPRGEPEFRSRLVSTMIALGFRHYYPGTRHLDISWGDRDTPLSRQLIDRLTAVGKRLPADASKQRQRVVDSLAFLEISAAWDPPMEITTQGVAQRVLPQVKTFLTRNRQSPDSPVAAMAAWLRGRFARYLVPSPDGD